MKPVLHLTSGSVGEATFSSDDRRKVAKDVSHYTLQTVGVSCYKVTIREFFEMFINRNENSPDLTNKYVPRTSHDQ